MRSLRDFINEALAQTNNKDLLKQLSSNADLAGYVDYLNKMIADPDAKAILTHAFLNAENNAYEFKGKMIDIPVTDLHPTQSEIDVDKSLGFPFKSEKTAKSSMKMFFDSSAVKMPFPLITFNGKFIVDGHHRWSQVYSFKPDAKMECFDLKVAKGGQISEQDMLKIVQGLLATKRAEDGKGNIPRSTVEGANLFKMNQKQVQDTIIDYCNRDIKVAEIIWTAAGQSDMEGLAEYLCDNLMMLRQDNLKYAMKGNNRGVMPQTDRGGDNPDDQESAKPDKKGSALHKLTHAKVDKDVI